MQSYTVRFHIDAPPRRVWRVLHPPVPPNSPRPRVLKWPTGSMEILHEGDEGGEGLVRTCIFEVPKYLLTGGKGVCRQRLHCTNFPDPTSYRQERTSD